VFDGFVGVGQMDVSPNANSIVFVTSGSPGQTVTIICDLPSCSKRRELPTLNCRLPRWLPAGDAIAYVPGTEPNIWVQPLDGRPAHQLPHFADDRPIVDSAGLATVSATIARSIVTNDIVLFKGLRK
jgi:hypothetical protein